MSDPKKPMGMNEEELEGALADDRAQRPPHICDKAESLTFLGEPVHRKFDGAEQLCKVLYGRPALPADYIGGKMLHDAAKAISLRNNALEMVDACLHSVWDDEEATTPLKSPCAERTHEDHIECWCKPTRDPEFPQVVIHNRVADA